MGTEDFPIRVSLELDVGGNPVIGRLCRPEEQPLPFSGYIELISLIETMRRKCDTTARDLAKSDPAPRAADTHG